MIAGIKMTIQMSIVFMVSNDQPEKLNNFICNSFIKNEILRNELDKRHIKRILLFVFVKMVFFFFKYSAPNVGLRRTTLRSRVSSSTDEASQAPPELGHFKLQNNIVERS